MDSPHKGSVMQNVFKYVDGPRGGLHDDVIKWKHFPRYWPFVRGIHRSPVNFPHKGQWRGALVFSLNCQLCVWINGWVNNREAGDLRRYRAHYDVIVTHSQYKYKFGMSNFRKIKMFRLFPKYWFLLASWVMVLKLKYCHITTDRHCVVLPRVCISWPENMSCVMYVIVIIHTRKLILPNYY